MTFFNKCYDKSPPQHNWASNNQTEFTLSSGQLNGPDQHGSSWASEHKPPPSLIEPTSNWYIINKERINPLIVLFSLSFKLLRSSSPQHHRAGYFSFLLSFFFFFKFSDHIQLTQAIFPLFPPPLIDVIEFGFLFFIFRFLFFSYFLRSDFSLFFLMYFFSSYYVPMLFFLDPMLLCSN